MAQSPSHKFGQILGDVFESAIGPLLQEFADSHSLYLDKQGPRSARKGRKVTWIDRFGNSHDLDFVLERGGTDQAIGQPVAFVETAWRRYTKHSRNKAQEIQGALLPLVETHRNVAPAVAVALAGVFTEGSLIQLRSLGFQVLYFPIDSVIAAFQVAGVDAYFDEDSTDPDVQAKVDQWEAVSPRVRQAVTDRLLHLEAEQIETFLSHLAKVALREIDSVVVVPLHGAAFRLNSVPEAISFVEEYDLTASREAVLRYEVEVLYNNGDRIRGEFKDQHDCLDFLRSFSPPPLRPLV